MLEPPDLAGPGADEVDAPWYGILGPLEVRAGGETLSIGSAKQRLLLTMLLLASGQVTSSEAMAEALWPAGPPSSARTTLNSLIFRLRKLLGPAATSLRTAGTGYTLDVNPAQVDAAVFDRSAAAGRASRMAGDHAAAALAFTRALALWRGRALEEVAAEPFAQAEAGRLEEARLALTEDLAEAELAGGRAEAALGLMGPHTAEHPLRERGWAVLMLAEYRLGRQGDALRSFQRARQALAEELGADPLPWLRRLEGMVLRQSPDLDSLALADLWAAGGEASRRPAAVPVARPSDTVRSNLGVPITPFSGRREELAQLRELVGRSRLVTLTGLGGVGKTRLAVELGRQLLDGYPDGVWMVALESLTDPQLVIPQVVSALGLHLEVDPRAPLDERLADHLATRRALLILDNCEQVVHGVAPLIRRLLGRCPDLRILATSQAVLGLAGEVTWPVPALGLPPADASAAVDLLGSDAVELFCNRAEAASGFRLTDDNAGAVGRICRLLEGIPLAVELAAARMRALGPEQIAERLDDRFRLLRVATGEVARHQTLRATMDWSYGLLGRAEQQVLQRLSVFRGSFDLAAAEAVLAGAEEDGASDDAEPLDAAEIIFRLVDRSLVAVQGGGEGSRCYRLLETVRQYAAEALAAEGGTAAAEARHTAYFVGLCQDRLSRRVDWWEGEEWPRRAQADEDNLRVALTRALVQGDQPAALTITASLWQSWFWMGRSEGSLWLERSLSGPARPETVQRVEAMCGLGLFLSFGDNLDRARAEVLLDEAAALAARVDHGETWARVVFIRGQLAAAQGERDQARRLLAEAQTSFESRRSPGAGWCELELGWVALAAGEEGVALRHFERAVALAARGEMLAPHALSALAPALAVAGDAGRASETAAEALRRARSGPARMVEVMCLARAAETSLILGDDRAAAALAMDLLALLRRVGARAWAAEAVELAVILLAPARPEAAAVLLATADSLRGERGELGPSFVRERLADARRQVGSASTAPTLTVAEALLRALALLGEVRSPQA